MVEAVRRLLGFRQVGHLGTLDPLATGVLVLLLGRATRFAQFYAARRKRYESAFRFGFATDTYDADGTARSGRIRPRSWTARNLSAWRRSLTGRFAQMPPPFSAKKVHGRPAHELARKNQPVELKPVEVEVFEFRLLEVCRFRRAVCRRMRLRDLYPRAGPSDGDGPGLRRSPGRKSCAPPWVNLRWIRPSAWRNSSRWFAPGKTADWILPLGRLLPELPRVNVLPIVEQRVRHGSKFQISLAQIQPGRVEVPQGAPAQLDSGEWKPGRLRVFNQQDQLIAIAEAVVPRTYQPVVVLDAEP